MVLKQKTHPMTCGKCGEVMDTTLCYKCQDKKEHALSLIECKSPALENKVFFAARCRPIGLTTYSNTPENAVNKLKQMFGAYVDALYKHGQFENKIGQ
jgi:predicted RNase H-like HicB family nuclease